MPVDDVMFSSESREWGTPLWLFDYYNERYKYTLDVCATPENAKVDRFIIESDNALAMNWSGERCWMNPPYGDEIGAWVHKAWQERYDYELITMLLPARTDTEWWHEWVADLVGARYEFLRSRVRFLLPDGNEAKSGAPFPSVVVTKVSRHIRLQQVSWVDLRHLRPRKERVRRGK